MGHRFGFCRSLVFASTALVLTSAIVALLAVSHRGHTQTKSPLRFQQQQQQQQNVAQEESASPRDSRSLSLKVLWAIQDPIPYLNDDNNTVTMEYGISDFVASNAQNRVRARIFAPDCATELGPADGISAHGVLADEASAAEHNTTVGAQFLAFEPIVLSKNQKEGVFGIAPDGKRANATMCLRYELWTGPESDALAVQVNYLETFLKIYFDLTAGFAVDGFQTEKKVFQEDETYERQRYTVLAYHCNPVTKAERHIELVEQGELVSICIEFEGFDGTEGLKIERVNHFAWSRQLAPGDYLVQPVVVNGVVDALGSVDCFAHHMCLMGTMLWADYFKTTGIVTGEGQVQFAFIDMGQRRMKGQMNMQMQGRKESPKEGPKERRRILQQGREPLSEPAGGFDISFSAVPASGRPHLLDTAGAFPFTLVFGSCWWWWMLMLLFHVLGTSWIVLP